jgi:hypothetical protein
MKPRLIVIGGIFAAFVVVGACTNSTETPAASEPKSEPSIVHTLTVGDACVAPWGNKHLSKLSNAEPGFGIGPLARLSMRAGQSSNELELLDAACDRAGF